MMHPPAGASQTEPTVLPSCWFSDEPMERRPMLEEEAVGEADTDVLGEREPEMVRDGVRLLDTLAVFVCVEPYDWLGELVGDRVGETVGVADGGTHELRTTLPAAPAVFAAPPPTLAKAL